MTVVALLLSVLAALLTGGLGVCSILVHRDLE